MADGLRSGGAFYAGETMLRIDPRGLGAPDIRAEHPGQLPIAMAVSLGFGIWFATFITLLLVPVAYLLLEASKRLGHRMAGPAWHQSQ